MPTTEEITRLGRYIASNGLINVSQGVQFIREKDPSARYLDKSTVRKHCVAGRVEGAVKWGREWYFSLAALLAWKEQFYRPRNEYRITRRMES